MPILPALQPLFRTIAQQGDAPSRNLPVREARERAHAAMEQYITGYYASVDPLPIERDLCVPVDGGFITVRLYAPSARQGPLPCHVYYHGGGFWLGRLKHFDPLCRASASDAQCAVASVDYRLAPEFKFPTAAEDAYAALLWLHENAGALNLDPTLMSVGGVSAGGNLAAVVCLMARERLGPPILLQVLEVPVLDLSTQKDLRIPEEAITLPSGKDLYCAYYLEDPVKALHPHVSPLHAANLTALPRALIMIAEYDPLAAEGRAYTKLLSEAGVPTELIEWKGQFHGAQSMARLIPDEAFSYHTRIVEFLRENHGIANVRFE
ncbi:alpha/beta hydrolase [Novosphingobium sp. G106]|uniref:alpha/beta hydrolase n=1 Tax=Novosphingobium sp. G106 TaxID=2849500 RepID=UPI001C2D1F11|nr:alpha/beta hydrolase [Novosphingobium sp. G106]MBV1688414.1 alpha/beta hydrolase [Novosphingobium sp. G106]